MDKYAKVQNITYTPDADDIVLIKRLPQSVRRTMIRWWPSHVPETWAETLADPDARSAVAVGGLGYTTAQARKEIAALRELSWATRAKAILSWHGSVSPSARWKVLRIGEKEAALLRKLPALVRNAGIAAMIVESMHPDEYVGFQGIGRDERIAGIPARTFVCKGLAQQILGTKYKAWKEEVARALEEVIEWH